MGAFINPQAGRLSRRSFGASLAALGYAQTHAAARNDAPAAQPNPKCVRCGGLGRVPLKDARPFVWIKGTALPKWETMVGEQFCPDCQNAGDHKLLAAEAQTQFEAALDKHQYWERETGWKLTCVVTRHAVVHTQVPAAQARTVGTAIETATLHLKRLTGSLALTPSRPDALGLMLLWDKTSWEKFRAVMERLFTPEQLGESWSLAREYNAYDQFTLPHLYETPQTARTRPPSCGATFMVTRRQLNLATNRQAPFWLLEGFAAYGDNVVHKTNRWYSVYDVKQIPPGNWLAEARKLAADGKLQEWPEMMQRELADWEWADHVQTVAMAAFLLESEPAKFLDFMRRLKSGDVPQPALESAYRASIAELDKACTRWLVSQR